MLRFVLSIVGIFMLSSVAQAAVYLKVYCPKPHASKTYNNQYIYIETLTQNGKGKYIKPVFKLTDSFGKVRLPNKYATPGLLTVVSVSAPAFPPKKTAIPGCTTKGIQLQNGTTDAHFSGGLTEDCGIVNVKSVCKP